MKTFKGKAIYQPSGKAAEYSKWAVNFYNGCSAKCEYCYNRHGITAKVLGCDTPTLKKSLINEEHAFGQFIYEAAKNLDQLRKDGLFFNFVSDPLLRETYRLNMKAMAFCELKLIPIKVLTKQTWWVPLVLSKEVYFPSNDIAIGFTLTGHDELEPGAASNNDRIRAMKVLHDEGFKTWASIEPIIDIESSMAMIDEIRDHVDLVKIGLQSGKKYDLSELIPFIHCYNGIADGFGFKIYWKDSLLKHAGFERSELPGCCVDRDYNIFES
jgi:DNA repair photolyase